MKKEKGILSSYDSLDIDEVIITIEKTFHIKFDERDFEEVKTYGEFEKLVLDKIQGIEINDCTSQQTFYKLRKILIEEFKIPYNRINLNTKLTEIFPKNIRNNEIKKLKSSLKFENQILTFSKEQFIILTIIFITSIYFLFTNFFYGLFFLAIGKILSEEMKKNNFLFKNLRELTNTLKIKNYKNSRKDYETYNPKEVKEIIKEIFSDSLDIEKSKIHHETIL